MVCNISPSLIGVLHHDWPIISKMIGVVCIDIDVMHNSFSLLFYNFFLHFENALVANPEHTIDFFVVVLMKMQWRKLF